MGFISFRLSAVAFIAISFVWMTSCLARSSSDEELLPFHAFIQGPHCNNCTGILISPEFVLAPGRCVNGSTTPVTLHLGFNNNNEEVQIVHSDVIFVHEEFAHAAKSYVNDIALIQLQYKVQLTDAVRPAKFISKEEFFLLDEQAVTVSGWLFDDSAWLSGIVRLLNTDTCKVLFNYNFLSSTKLCATAHDITNYYHGDPVSLDGKVLGFMSRGPCPISSKSCNTHEQIQVIPPYFDWIERHSCVNITATTDAEKRRRDASSEQYNGGFKKLSQIVDKHDKLIKELETGQNHQVIEAIENIENRTLDDMRSKIGELSEKIKYLETTVREIKAALGETKRLEIFEKLIQENHDLLRHIKEHIEGFSSYPTRIPAVN